MPIFNKTAIGLTVGLLLSATMNAPAFARAGNIVLVHGAAVDGSGWRGVYDILTRDGYNVSIVQQPLTGLDQDLSAVERVLGEQDGDVILVGHSYGGTIITAAGDDPKVKALVYVAALQPDRGESSAKLVQSMPPPSNDVKPTEDGYLVRDPEKFFADFGADLPEHQAVFMAQSQMRLSVASFTTPVAVAAWHGKPSYGIVAKNDMTITPNLERWMYKRSSSTVTEIDGSHAIYISHAPEVAKVIEHAAEAAR